MNRGAEQYAKKLAATGTGQLQHSSKGERPGQGENLAMTCIRGGKLSIIYITDVTLNLTESIIIIKIIISIWI